MEKNIFFGNELYFLTCLNFLENSEIISEIPETFELYEKKTVFFSENYIDYISGICVFIRSKNLLKNSENLICVNEEFLLSAINLIFNLDFKIIPLEILKSQNLYSSLMIYILTAKTHIYKNLKYIEPEDIFTYEKNNLLQGLKLKFQKILKKTGIPHLNTYYTLIKNKTTC